MTLISALPLLRGWKYSAMDIDTAFSVAAKDEHVLYETIGKGWVISILISLSDPNAQLTVTTHDSYIRPYKADISPSNLQALRQIYPNPAGVWVSTYDTVNSVYVVNYNPLPWLQFQKQGILSVKASTIPLVIYGYAHLLIEITDEKEFMQSLKELGGG